MDKSGDEPWTLHYEGDAAKALSRIRDERHYTNEELADIIIALADAIHDAQKRGDMILLAEKGRKLTKQLLYPPAQADLRAAAAPEEQHSPSVLSEISYLDPDYEQKAPERHGIRERLKRLIRKEPGNSTGR